MTLKRNEVSSAATPRTFQKIKREQRKTGGGNLPAVCFVTPLEDKIQSIFGETAISRIDGGIEPLVVDKERCWFLIIYIKIIQSLK